MFEEYNLLINFMKQSSMLFYLWWSIDEEHLCFGHAPTVCNSRTYCCIDRRLCCCNVCHQQDREPWRNTIRIRTKRSLCLGIGCPMDVPTSLNLESFSINDWRKDWTFQCHHILLALCLGNSGNYCRYADSWHLHQDGFWSIYWSFTNAIWVEPRGYWFRLRDLQHSFRCYISTGW